MTSPLLKRIRYVIYSEEYGIYLGSCAGLGFWSKLDPVGQTHAISFDNKEQTAEVIASWESTPPLNTRAVAVLSDDPYVSIIECVAAGLPGWAA